MTEEDCNKKKKKKSSQQHHGNGQYFSFQQSELHTASDGHIFHRSYNFIVELIATEYCEGHMHKQVLKSDYRN